MAPRREETLTYANGRNILLLNAKTLQVHTYCEVRPGPCVRWQPRAAVRAGGTG
jgi:hypothetical protein